MICRSAGDWAGGVGNNAVCKNIVSVGKSVIAGRGAEAQLTAAFASVLLVDFELSFPELELAPEPNLKSTLVPDSAPDFVLKFDADAATRDWLGRCSAREPKMEEASATPKLEDSGGLAAVEAACFAIEIGSATTCIGIPQVRLHSTRQSRDVLEWPGTHRAVGAISET